MTRRFALPLLLLTLLLAPGCRATELSVPGPTAGRLGPPTVPGPIIVTSQNDRAVFEGRAQGLANRLQSVSVESQRGPATRILVRSSGKAEPSGWNFLRVLPGFLVFAPSWSPLCWDYEVTTVATIIFPGAGRGSETVTRTDRYEVRQLTPGYALGSYLAWIAGGNIPGLITTVVTAVASVMDTLSTDAELAPLEAAVTGRIAEQSFGPLVDEIVAALQRR